MQPQRVSARKTKGIPPVRFDQRSATQKLAMSESTGDIRGSESDAASSGDASSSDLDNTVVADHPTTDANGASEQQQHDASTPPDVASMCQMLAALQQQMQRAEQWTAQQMQRAEQRAAEQMQRAEERAAEREVAVGNMIDELSQRINVNSSTHSGASQSRRVAFPDASGPQLGCHAKASALPAHQYSNAHGAHHSSVAVGGQQPMRVAFSDASDPQLGHHAEAPVNVGGHQSVSPQQCSGANGTYHSTSAISVQAPHHSRATGSTTMHTPGPVFTHASSVPAPGAVPAYTPGRPHNSMRAPVLPAAHYPPSAFVSERHAHSNPIVNPPAAARPNEYFVQMPQSVYSPMQPAYPPMQPVYDPVCAPPPQQLNIAPAYRHQRKLLDLPPFNGMLKDWPKFDAAFRNTTAMYGYDDGENLQRLQKALSGEAEQAVEGLLIQPHHVGEVMAALQDEFGDPDLLICNQIDRVRKLPQVYESNLEQLVPFATVVRNVATYLEGPTTIHHQTNPMLLKELVKKLPMSRRIEWQNVAAQIRPHTTVRDFANWLSGLARLIRQVSSSETAATKPVTSSQNAAAGRSSGKAQVPRRVMLTNSAHDSNVAVASGGKRRCGFCAKEHETSKCFSFKRSTPTERWRVVRERAWCFGCLNEGHILPSCNARRMCAVNGCTQYHHALLHERDDEQQRRTDNGRWKQRRGSRGEGEMAPTKESTESTMKSNNAAQSAASNATAPNDVQQAQVCTVQEGMTRNTMLFRVMPVVLHANGRELSTYALFDEGSSVSLVDDTVAEQLGIDGPANDLSVKWFGRHSTVLRSRKLTLGISGQSRPGKQFNMTVRTIRNLSLPTQTVEPEALYESNPHLRDVPIETFRNAVPRVLIGLDNHHLGTPQEVKAGADDDGIVAVRSKLGWAVYGSDGPAFLPNAMVCLIDGERDDEYELLNATVRSFINSEEFGVRTPTAAIESDEDIRARAILKETTKRVGERYETGLLWRHDDVQLPSSFDMALRRLVNVEARMRRDSEFARQYNEQINAYLAKGYARKLTDAEARRQDSRTWFLPHFAVVNPNKPGKFRIVFDAAAKVAGESLNSSLLSGPDDNMPLARLLLQFRLGEVGVCGDIAEMYHQVRVREEDQRAQRFLWRGGDSSAPPGVYTMSVMTFGATCSPAAAQHVKNTNADEFRHEYPEAAEAIRRRHYVDDYVASFATAEEAARVSAQVVEVHRRGGFVLRGFVSNSDVVLEALGVSTGPGEAVDLDPDAALEKILGMTWNTADDTFRFRTRFARVPQGILDGTKRPTKRTILSTCMSVFDPYGLLANFMLAPKMMVQDLFRMGLDWDEPAPDEIWQRWETWRVEIPRTRLLAVPRCAFRDIKAITDLQLHLYADASEAAFAAVAFWRVARGDKVDLSFVAGKVKVAPTPIQSMPRLELNAAVLATRLLDEIRRSHDGVKIGKIVMWSDSETVLKWIRSDQRKYKQYVGFRVAEIAESTEASWWRWVPTSMNAADDGTRIKSPLVFDPDGRWIWGPAWLRDGEELWPKQRNAVNDAEQHPEEIRSKYVGIAVMQPLIDFTRFSKLFRLCRTVAWMVRFRTNAQCKQLGTRRADGELTAGEVDAGLVLICRMVQMETYSSEYKTLQRGKQLDRTSSIFVLNPYLDDTGLMRLHGRTDAASDAYMAHDARRPIILPRQHHVTMLLARHHHERLAHQLVDATIASIRQRFWVPQVRVLVKSVQSACQRCRVRTTTPQTPVQGQLPIDRITPHVRPFEHTGLDYFGPVTVRIGRRHEKRWIALYTCLVIRAVHLEIATNLSTDACLLTIRNFINLRGLPKLIRCDNGTNFIGARNLLDKDDAFFDPDAIQRELTTRGISWKFNRPGNPEAGGAWERMVQSVKRVLAVTLQQATPEVETLRAHLIEAANMINSRPLTHIPVDPEEDEPITPNHFLLGGANLATVPDPADARSLCSRDQWVQCREMSRQFWSRWVRDYLPELTRRSRHYPARSPMQQGDLVIICDDGQPRSQWARGRVVETTIGADGIVRSAKVRTTDGEYWRPTTKLAVIDVSLPRITSTDGARDVGNSG